MKTYFIQMHSGHTQEVEGVKEVYKFDSDYSFVDENETIITCVPVANMAFYTVVKSETVEATPVYCGDVEFSKGIVLIGGKTIVELINESEGSITIKAPSIKLDGVVTVNQNWDGKTAEAKSIEIAKMIIKSFENEAKNETPPKVGR